MTQSATPPPPAPVQGRNVLAYLKDLEKWLRKSVAVPGAGIRSTQTATGRVFNVEAPPEVIITTIPSQWELYQEDAATNPLEVSMRPGVLVNTNATSLYPQNTLKNWTTANVTASQTTIFWLKVTVAKSTYQTYFEVWHVTAAVVETGTTLPTNTLDIPAGTGGDLHFQIGSVTADGSAVTSIVQDLSNTVTVVFPLGVVGEVFTCPAEETP